MSDEQKTIRCVQCGASNWKKSGFNRHRRQRYMCKKCGKTSYHANYGYGRIPKHKEEQIAELLSAGYSIRNTAEIVGVTYTTVQTRRASEFPAEELHEPRPSKGGCDYCGKPVRQDKERNRKTARTKHGFCDQSCYIKFYLVTNENRLANYLERKLKNA